VEEIGGDVRVRKLATLEELRGIFKDAPGRGTKELEQQRQHDRELEERKMRRWNG
jgi:hypothetical protein